MEIRRLKRKFEIVKMVNEKRIIEFVDSNMLPVYVDYTTHNTLAQESAINSRTDFCNKFTDTKQFMRTFIRTWRSQSSSRVCWSFHA